MLRLTILLSGMVLFTGVCFPRVPVISLGFSETHMVKYLDCQHLEGHEGDWLIQLNRQGLPEIQIGDDDPDGPLEGDLSELVGAILISETAFNELIQSIPLMMELIEKSQVKLIDATGLTMINEGEDDPLEEGQDIHYKLMKVLFSLPGGLMAIQTTELEFEQLLNQGEYIENLLQDPQIHLLKQVPITTSCMQCTMVLEMELPELVQIIDIILLNGIALPEEFSAYIKLNNP